MNHSSFRLPRPFAAALQKLGPFLLIPCLAAPAFADSSKANNTTAVDDPASWTNSTVPGAADIAIWDSNFTAANAATQPGMAADLSWKGIRVTNVAGGRNVATMMAAVLNAGSANTLTLGASGIDSSAAFHTLKLQPSIMIGASQTWNVSNASNIVNPAAFNNGEDLAFEAQAAGAPFNLGGNVVTNTGAGQVTITSGYTISNGTINVGSPFFVIQGGTSRLTTVNNDVIFNVGAGARLHFQCNSGSVASSATVNLTGGILALCNNNNVATANVGGIVNVLLPSTISVSRNFANGTINGGNPSNPVTFSGNLTGSASLSFTNDTTNVFANVTGDNSAYSGTVTLGGTANRMTRMASSTAGSAAATWAVTPGHTLELDGVNVQLGAINGGGTITNFSGGVPSSITVKSGTFAGTLSDGPLIGGLGLTKQGPGVLTLTGQVNYTGPTLVSAGRLNVDTLGSGLSDTTVADGATFSVRVSSPGAARSHGNLTVGSVTGATVAVDLGPAGNPAPAPIYCSTFAANAPTILEISGSNFAAGTFPLIDYVGAIAFGGGLNFNTAFTLKKPTRLAAQLVNNIADGRVDVLVQGDDTPKWIGNLSTNWDVDDGTPTGTLNWKTSFSNVATRYLQGPAGIDSVRFDDSAQPASTNVNLTTTLTPASLTVENTALNYKFIGSGKISGPTSLLKKGTGSLTIANTAANDYSGITTVANGTLFVGDGVTPGVGSLGSGPVVNSSILVLNRPDDFAVSNAFTNSGTFQKEQANTVSMTSATPLDGTVTINAGTLLFPNAVTSPAVSATINSGMLHLSGGGTLSAGVTVNAGGILRLSNGGFISGGLFGAGELQATGGTVEINGNINNDIATTRVSGGTLRLNRTGGNALGNSVIVTGGAILTMIANENIADTATITFNGTSADSTVNSTGTETVANVIVNASVATGQFIFRNNFTITGTCTIQNGIGACASAHTSHFNAVNLTGGTLRIAGSTAATTLNVGPGGITASGGVIEVKFNTNNQDATINLGGNFTATGNVLINNAGYTGANLNIINLTDTRTFDVATGATLTVRPDLGGPGGLIKAGAGTLLLDPSVTTSYAGLTTVSAGILDLRGAINGDVQVTGGTLAGTGSITTAASGVAVNAAGHLSPGTAATPVGTLTINAAGAQLNLATVAAGSLIFDLASTAASDRVLLTTGALNIGAGTLGIDDFAFTAGGGFAPGTYTLIETSEPIVGALAPNVTGPVGGITGTLAKADGDTNLVLIVTNGLSTLQQWRQTHFGVTTNTGNAANNADPDNDGVANLAEFAQGTIPTDAASRSGPTALTAGAQFTFEYTRPNNALTSVSYTPEISTTLGAWTSVGVSQSVINDNTTIQTVRVTVAKDVPVRFVRIKFQEL